MSINSFWEKLDLEKKLILLKKKFPNVTLDNYKEKEKLFLEDKSVLKKFKEVEISAFKNSIANGRLMLENIEERYGERDIHGHRPNWDYHTQGSRARGRCR